MSRINYLRRYLRQFLVALSLPILVSACSSVGEYNQAGELPHALVTNQNIYQQNLKNDPELAQQSLGLKNTVYPLFFKEGLFAGQDKVGYADLKYQRWQVPLMVGALLDYDRNYAGKFNDFLPSLATAGNYDQMLDLIYRINNWDTLPANQLHALCKLTVHCFLIDDRLWWVNALISYAEGLASRNPHDPYVDKLFHYAYSIYMTGISRPEYVNEIGTPGAKSVMWFSGPQLAPEYKSTISNSLYVTAGARLAKFIKFQYGESNQQYNYTLVLKRAQLVADGYFIKYGDRLKSNGLLLDGIGTGGKNSPRKDPVGQVVNQMFSYNQGVVLPGLAILTQLTGKHKYLDYAKGLIRDSYQYSRQHNNFWDDYGYTEAGGWFADDDGIGFRLAYWQYLGLFLENYNLDSDLDFQQLLITFVANNYQQLVVRPVDLSSYGLIESPTLASPNHNNWAKLPTGALFTGYPDGYSLPASAAALELTILQGRLLATVAAE